MLKRREISETLLPNRSVTPERQQKSRKHENSRPNWIRSSTQSHDHMVSQPPPNQVQLRVESLLQHGKQRDWIRIVEPLIGRFCPAEHLVAGNESRKRHLPDRPPPDSGPNASPDRGVSRNSEPVAQKWVVCQFQRMTERRLRTAKTTNAITHNTSKAT